MMAFFFTMPINSTMPMMATTVSSVAADHQREQRADAGRRQRGKNRDRVDIALVQHAQNDVNRHQRRQDQQRLVGQRSDEGLRRALERGLHRGRRGQFLFHFLDGVDRLAQRRVRRQIEGNSRCRKLPDVADQDRHGTTAKLGERTQRDRRRPSLDLM